MSHEGKGQFIRDLRQSGATDKQVPQWSDSLNKWGVATIYEDFRWIEEPDSASLVAGVGLVKTGATLSVFTLPTVASVGEKFAILGEGSGNFRVEQNSGQSIHLGNETTTPGLTGRVNSVHYGNGIVLMCVVENYEFRALSLLGNFTII